MGMELLSLLSGNGIALVNTPLEGTIQHITIGSLMYRLFLFKCLY